MTRTKLLLASALFAAAGCVAPPPTAARSQAIINGTVDEGDPAVVSLLAQVPGQQGGSLCTAEIISPHVVLTAAHCVAPSTVGEGAQFVVFTGTELSVSSPKEDFLKVKETHYVPTFLYNPMTGADQDDVAVVILDAPTTIAPIPFNHFPLDDSVKQAPTRIVGYGLTDGNDSTGDTAGTRHQAPSAIFNIQKDTLTLYDKLHSNCEGDSGGPVLVTIDGKELIAGITQVGYVGCPVDMSSSDTRIDTYADFVDMYVRMFDPPAVAAGATCASDSDCAPLTCGDTSVGKICEQPCDPAADTSICPEGTKCIDLDGKTMCATPKHHSGCAMGGDGAGGGALALLLLAAFGGLVRRRLARAR